MPKSAARSRRSIATVTSTAVIGASLAVLLLPVAAPIASAAAAPGTTERASLKSPGNTPTDSSGQDSVLSGNGESVAFTSQSQLDPTIKTGSGSSAPNYKNVFVRDLVLKRTVMISRGQFDPPPTGSGTVHVNFGPEKMLELQPGGGGGTSDGVPIRDTAPTGNSYTPSISSDGRFVAFSTAMSNMFLNDTSFRAKIVVVDRDPNGDGKYDEEVTRFGVLSKDYKYYLISGREGDLGSPYTPKIAGNASRIVWVAKSDGRLRLATSTLNLRAGTIGPITRVPAATPLNFFLDEQDDPAISGDGNHIVMHTRYLSTCDCSNPPGFHAILSADMRQANSVIRVDVDAGKPISTSRLEIVKHPAVNGDGSVIAFVLDEHRLVGDDPPREVFPDEPITFAVLIAGNKITRTDIVSRDNAFNVIHGERPGLSSDGRYLAFVTDSPRAHDGNDGKTSEFTCIKPPPQSPGLRAEPMLRLTAAAQQARVTCQVVVRDLIVDLDRRINEQSRLPGTLVSGNQAGNAGNGSTVPDVDFSTAPSLSDNGGRVAFDSEALDLATPEDRHTPQVYVRTMQPGLSGEAVKFGDVRINTTSTKTAVLTETGSGPLNVEAISIIGTNAAEFTVGTQTCTGQTVHATGSCEVSVTFGPKAVGDRSAQLLVRIRGDRRAIVDLTGKGTPEPVQPKGPEFSAEPTTLAFGTRLLLSTGPEATVTVTNKGKSPLQISAIDIVGTPAPDYKVTKNTCGASVAGSATCTVSVAFSPKASGNRDAVLRFFHNAQGGPHLVGLTGTAPQPTIQVNPGVTPPGRVVTVIGKDFPTGLPITVKFLDRIGQTVITAKDDGTFQAPLLIFPKAAPETRTIQATMPQFGGPLATIPLLIVFPTVSPANFVVRG